ncbi:hypothetical protein ACFE04_013921 [Oxalis oulophora]
MVKKPRIVIIGAGMAGLTAANKLYSSNKDSFDLSIIEAGPRIGGRINTSEFNGNLIEMGATWIHGIGGSPLHQIAQQINSLQSHRPWECMDGFPSDDQTLTVAEGGLHLNPSIVEPVTTLFNNLMDYAQGKLIVDQKSSQSLDFYKWVDAELVDKVSVGSYLRQGFDSYCHILNNGEENGVNGFGDWDRNLLKDAIFRIHENTQRTYTSAGDLLKLDYKAESEYVMFPGEEITIAKGYLSVIQHLASVLPAGMIQLGRKVEKIEWQPEKGGHVVEHGCCSRPVKLHFSDGSIMEADHVIVTVSLGVLKQGINQSSGLFNPELPSFKTEAISRLGYGVVNKLFLQLSNDVGKKFPFLQMAFHRKDSESRNNKIPWWMRRTSSIVPIHNNSNVLLSWFAGEEALELEKLTDEEIIEGVTTTVSSFLPSQSKTCNGEVKFDRVKFSKVLRSKWARDPLFLGSYSYVAVGSSGDDIDTMAKPLPESSHGDSSPLQILFAGEATHRTHYSTTHGAYFSGLREANRLIQHYQSVGV